MWLIFIFSFKLWAADPAQPAIEKAQSLALKKNRVEACAVLRRALDELPAGAKSRAKIAEALGQISKMFFTDKGQKFFEAGQSSMWDTPDMALAQFKEALALENQNIQVLDNIARIQLFKQDCDGALQTLDQARKLNPASGESAVLELRALSCKQNFESLREKAKNLPALDKWEESYVQYLLAGDALQQKSYKKAFDALFKLTEENPQFPESYLLLARAAGEMNKDPEPFLEKYVSLCKAATAREKKKYSLEPRLCANLKEAEDELAKKKAL
jgi:predicted Zn-dependent protease